MLIFDRERLRRVLERLEWPKQVAFGALCAERLLPHYRRFVATEGWGDSQALQEGIAAAWKTVRGAPLQRREYQELLARVTQATPDTQDFSGPFVSFALDAAVAVAGTLASCIKPDVAETVDVAQAAFDAAFGVAQLEEDSDIGRVRIGDRARLSQMLDEARVQYELRLQEGCLADLAAAGSIDVDVLRNRYGVVAPA